MQTTQFVIVLKEGDRFLLTISSRVAGDPNKIKEEVTYLLESGKTFRLPDHTILSRI